MIETKRRVLRTVIALAALGAATLSAPAAGQQYPSKPVRVMAPFPAGSGVDIVARLIGTPLSQALGQGVVVDNRPGANGTIACELAAKAPPDGYTLLFGNASTLAMAAGRPRPCAWRHVSRAVVSAARLPAVPPLTNTPPAPSGRPASCVSHARVAFSAWIAPAPSSHQSP